MESLVDSVRANHRYPFSMLTFETARLRCRPLTLSEYASFNEGHEPTWPDLSNPYGHLISGPSPLAFRSPRVAANPTFAEIGLVLAIDKVSNELIGEQLDEIDGRELIFELPVNDFKERYGGDERI